MRTDEKCFQNVYVCVCGGGGVPLLHSQNKSD